MAKNKGETGPEENDKKVTKKAEKNKVSEVKKKTQKKIQKKIEKVEKVVENKSVQNKVIDNIKNFISKIIELQEKVKRDAEEEKLKKEENQKKKEDKKAPKYLLEYYDLPFRYNETVVKILAQTPKRLFVYWDVSDKDKQTYLNAFGENFFYDTYPVLLVHNEDKNDTSEIAINDFANSWYLDIANPRDKYTIQLGRKFKSHVRPQINKDVEKENITLNHDFLLIAMSNQLEVPNDHVLFEEFKPYITYRNVKTQVEEMKNIETSIYKNELEALYQKLYKNQRILDKNGKFDLLNPSSMGTSTSVAK